MKSMMGEISSQTEPYLS